MPLSAVRRIGAIPLPSLVDEIGLVFEGENGEHMHIRETDPGFRELSERFRVDVLLGENWYGRAEAGQYLWAMLPTD